MVSKAAGKERDIEKTRQQILDAAAVEFSTHSFSGGRVDRISRRAGVNKAMIYYIFHNKENLHLAVLEHLFETKIREVERYLTQEAVSLPDMLSLLPVYLKTLLERGDYTGIILHDLATGAHALRKLRKRRPDLFAEFDIIGDRLKNLADTGLIRAVDADKSVAAIIVMIIGLANLLPHMDLLADKNTRRYRELINTDGWLAFMADILGRAMKTEN